MTPLAIAIQARLGSTRFPRKVLAPLDGAASLLACVVRRAHEIWPGTPVVVLAPAQDWATLQRVVAPTQVLGGAEEPLERYARWAQRDQITTVVRLTGDSPLLDPGLARACLERFYGPEHPRYVVTSPALDGLDVEVVAGADVWAAYVRAQDARDREHVTPWIRRQPGGIVVEHPETLRWSVDTPGDLAWVRQVYQACESCRWAIPHHTNAGGSIGGVERHLVVDLHAMPAGDLAECRAAELLRERMGGAVYDSV